MTGVSGSVYAQLFRSSEDDAPVSDRRIDDQIGHAFEKEHFGLMAVNVMSPYSDLGTKRLAFR